LFRGLYLLIFLSFPLCAQWKNLKEYNFNVKIHSGFILEHNSDVAQLANQHPRILEIDAYRQTNGNKPWQQVHHFPRLGYSFNYVFLDPSKPLGNMASLVFYMSKTIFKTRGSRLEIRLGMGPGYADKTFDLHQNPKNNMISTRYLFCLNGRINYVVNIGKHINLNTGIGIIHFSNGSIKLPNQGINIPSVHLGIGFQQQKTVTITSDSLPKTKKMLSLDVMFAGGIKEEYPINGPKFFVSTISAYLNKRLNYKSGLTLGLDLFYDPSIDRYFDTPHSFFEKTKAGISAGHELYFGKLSLLTQLGVYVRDPYKLNAPVYERYGFKYKLYKNCFLQLSMKIHYGSVDYVEWGTGIRI
jgi:hypothetical protein